MHVKVISDIQELKLIDFEPTLVFVFYTHPCENSCAQEAELILAKFQNIDLIGCSGNDLIGNEYPYLSDISHCMYIFTDIKKEAYSLNVFFDESLELDQHTMHQDSGYSALLLTTHNNKLENDYVLNKLRNEYGIRNIFGALAANDPLDFSSDHVSLFYNGRYESKGYILLLLDENYYTLTGESFFPFEPIGLELQVTKVDEKSILEIEGKPALDMLESLMGKMSEEGIDHFHYPLYIWNPKSIICDQRYPLRSIRKVDREDKSLHFFNYIDPDSRLKIAIQVQDIHVQQHLQNMKDEIQSDSLNFIFMCVVYRKFWENTEQVQLMQIMEESDGTFCGFHAFGEIGYEKSYEGCSVLQNQTLTYISITENRGSQNDRR